MAKDLRHVWICTATGELIRADRIISLNVRPSKVGNEVNEYHDDELTALLDNGATVHLAYGGYAPAWQSMVHLAGAISLAADEVEHSEETDTGATFVYPASYDDSSYDGDNPLWLYCARQLPFSTWPTGPQPRKRPAVPGPPWLAERSAEPPPPLGSD
jgi:hypothetical protein